MRLLQASGDRAFLVDADHRIQALPGYREAGTVPGTPVVDLFVPQERQAVEAALEAARATGAATVLAAMVGDLDRHWQCRILRLEDPSDWLLVGARDATEYRIALNDAEVRGRLYKALVEATSEMIWHMDLRAGTVQRVGWEAFTGLSKPTNGIHSWIEAVHPDDRLRAAAAISASVTAKEPFTVEYRLTHVGGDWRTVEDHAVPIVAATGEITDWVGVVTDCHDARVAEEALRTSEQRLRVAVAATGLGTWDVDLATGTLQVSPELRAMIGLPAAAPVGADSLSALMAPLRDKRPPPASVAYAGPPDGVFRIVRPDTGAGRWIRSLGQVTCDRDGARQHRIGTFQDITEAVEIRQALKLALSRSEALIAATSVIVWQSDAEQRNGTHRGWSEFTGTSGEDPGGRTWIEAVHPDDKTRILDHRREAMDAWQAYENEYRLAHRTGGYRWVHERVVPLFDPDGGLAEWVGIVSDIHARKTAEEEIWRAAHIDDLTGLQNRAQFQQSLDVALAAAIEAGTTVGLLLIDLDHFKEINDGFGHDAGDVVLKTVAARLEALCSAPNVIARLGGDEFALIMPKENQETIEALASEILSVVRRPIRYADRELHCTATIGYALYPRHDDDPAALLKSADMALYAAKSAGRGRVQPFAGEMRAEFDRRIAVLRCARDALDRDAIVPFYQPKVSLKSGRVEGLEALLRWTDGTGLKTPGAIQEAFEDHDLAARLGVVMLEKVTADLLGWRIDGVEVGHVAINVAGPELANPGLATRILDRLQACSLPPTCLEVEITEGVLMDTGTDTASQELKILHEGGIRISLDDFGTGYASLTHLKRHPVATIKIDRSFVWKLESERDSAVIVQALLGMAGNLGVQVVAEGVETAWQLDFLKRHGCDLVQGYFIAKPMPASRVAHFLATFDPALVGGPAAGGHPERRRARASR